MPFNEILNLGISGVSPLTDNAPVKTDGTSIDFSHVLEAVLNANPGLKQMLNDLDDGARGLLSKLTEAMRPTEKTWEVEAQSQTTVNPIVAVLNDTKNENLYFNGETDLTRFTGVCDALGINIPNILYHLMTDKNVHSFEARLIGGEKGWGNISSTVEKTGDVKVGDEIEGIEKASVELMRVILGLISRLKNQIINTQVNPDAHISNLSEKDLLPDLNQKTPEPPEVLIQKETFPHISVHTNKTITVIDNNYRDKDAPTDTRQPEIDPILTVPTFIPDGTYKVEVKPKNNNIIADAPSPLPDLNQKTPEPPEVLIQKETFPHISVHTNKTITVIDNNYRDKDAPTDTRQPEIDPILTVPTFIPDGTYKVEVTIINNNLKETGQEENNHIWRGPEVVAENRTVGAQIRDIFYVTNTKEVTKEVAPHHPAFDIIEKGQVDQGIIKDIISINESPSKTKTVSHTYHSDRDISQTELDERIKEVRISIGTDAMGSSFNGRDENMPHIMEEKEMAKIVHEKTGTKDKPSDTAGDRIAFNDALDKNVLHIKDDIQGQIRPVAAQKIEEIVERYSEVKKSGDMLIRFKIDNGEILELNLKNNGENILIHIKSTNSELISMFTNQRDMIIKSLEEKNIFASIFINPDGANNQEKQEEKQRNSRYRPGKIPTDGFSEILEAQV